MSPAAALEFVDVVKRFGAGSTEVRALSGVSLRVEPGEFVAVMGPSGCGKSTLLHLAGALEDPRQGACFVGGHDLADLDVRGHAALRRSEVGYVFQRLNLLASLTAIENVDAAAGARRRVGSRGARHGATEALRERRAARSSSIATRTTSPAASSSASPSPARSWANAELLLADEPTGSLDTATGDSVIELLAALPAGTAPRWCSVTHEPRFAQLDRSCGVPPRRAHRGPDQCASGDRRSRRRPCRRSGGCAMTMLDDRPVDDLDRPSPWSSAAMSSAAEVGRWRLAARLARREIRRRPWRTLLVVLLIGVPVAGMVVGDAAYRSGQLPEDQSHRFGAADVRA